MSESTIQQVRTIFGQIMENEQKDCLDGCDDLLLARIERSQRAIEASIRQRDAQRRKVA